MAYAVNNVGPHTPETRPDPDVFDITYNYMIIYCLKLKVTDLQIIDYQLDNSIGSTKHCCKITICIAGINNQQRNFTDYNDSLNCFLPDCQLLDMDVRLGSEISEDLPRICQTYPSKTSKS
jgi:hypothetical protein